MTVKRTERGFTKTAKSKNRGNLFKRNGEGQNPGYSILKKKS